MNYGAFLLYGLLGEGKKNGSPTSDCCGGGKLNGAFCMYFFGRG